MQVSARQYVRQLKTHRLGPSDLGEMVEKQLTHLNQPLGENINWSVLFANGSFWARQSDTTTNSQFKAIGSSSTLKT